MTAPLVEIVSLGKTYGHVTALQDVSLTIQAGEFLTFLGPSGSGKSTILMAIAGFVVPTSGQVRMEGRDITDLPPEKRDFGVVFQGYALFPHMTVAENVGYPLRIRKVAAADLIARVGNVLERVGLSEMADRPVARLSGGQQQRVALARALIYQPKMLLLDEPLSALDRRLRQGMQQELTRMHRDFGMTFVFVTHDQEEALALSDRIVVFNNGRIEQIGTPGDIYERPVNRFVAQFLGDMNLLPLHGADRHEGTADVRLSAGPGKHLRVRIDRAQETDGATLLGIRPERLELYPDQPDGNALAVTVAGLTYQGTHLNVDLLCEGLPDMSARLRVDHPLVGSLDPGQSLWCGWAPVHGRLLCE